MTIELIMAIGLWCGTFDYGWAGSGSRSVECCRKRLFECLEKPGNFKPDQLQCFKKTKILDCHE